MVDEISLGENALLALDTIYKKQTKKIPSWVIHPMEHSVIDYLAGEQPGAYVKFPRQTYLKMQKNIGTCMIDQYIPENPLSIGTKGFEKKQDTPTTGAKEIVCDGMKIDSPEAVVEHMEKFIFPKIKHNIKTWSEDFIVPIAEKIINNEKEIQTEFGPDILKVPYGVAMFPGFGYGTYGYENYFMAYALYPDVIEKYFSLVADYCQLYNNAVALAYEKGNLAPLLRLDHDMAGEKGTLVNIKSLDKMWFPHFERSIKVLVDKITLIWHCDGNLMEMVPRLIECGIKGFQGFQYECGMDYEKICKMKTKNGEDLFIIAGVSVTRTLPFGTPEDVKNEMKWLVEHGPKTGLFLGGSSSIPPQVPLKNILAFVEGLQYYRKHGRTL
ncbi:MAG TPA: uroporphyrinogen decarboxylase family protein [bacterium]|nr:uroporphyrinogen decarboxylase family protein [bacterium]HOL34895.1 uroporphyrinogen decarboxylase family protein [bacterium]HPP08582.1 uroporphyrinogen decarboxylase family protein [bacterium]